jgi:hypothetical protein
MHSSLAVFIMVCALASAQSSHAQSSFGPEISAEDFNQHLWALRAPGFTGQYADAYLRTQFDRLGLDTRETACAGNIQGLQAVLPGTGPAGDTVIYLANPGKPHEVAAILEIAERFMTERPRPAHAVVFLVSTAGAGELPACASFRKTARIIQPSGMETRDPDDLVMDLIMLQRQGR